MANSDIHHAPTVRSQVHLASGVTIVAGIWLILAPFVLGYADGGAPNWNSIIVGLVVAVLALIRVGAPHRNVSASWIIVALGVWLIVAPFALNYAAFLPALWNDIIVGAVIIVFGAWSAAATRRRSVV